MKQMRKALAFMLCLVLMFGTVTWTTSFAAGGNSPQANVTLTFKANGSGATGAPDPITASANTVITIPLTEPTRDGYKFLGWAFSSTTSQPSDELKPGVKYTLKGNVTAYAVWHTKCTLTYSANGGTNAPAAVSDYGEIKITSDKPKRDGYTFFGWAQTAGATDVWITAGETYNLKADVTLYAVWKQFTISFDPNGGTGAPAPLKGGTVKIPDTEPTRPGYSFLGWTPSIQATSPSSNYAKGKTVSDLKGNINLYAVWKKAHTLTFDLNGGSGTTPDPVSGSTVAFPWKSNKFYRSGYSFIGWADSKTATTAKYQQFETIDLTADKKVYAVWLDDTSAWKPLSYSANGGDYAQSPDQELVSSTGMVKLSSDEPTREGYTFLGWSTYYTDQFTEYLAGSSYYVRGDPNTLDDVDTLYAVWAPAGSAVRTLTYYANGGSGLVPPVRKTYGSVETPGYRDTAEPGYKLTRSGYTQMGWNTKADGNGSTYTAGASFTPSKDYTFYALWKQFTLTFDANEGTGGPTSTLKGGDVTIPSAKPTRSGYVFLGWSTSSTATVPGAAYAAGKTVTLTKDLTLYAVWRQEYTLTFDLNGGSGTTPASVRGSTVAFPWKSNKFYRTGYSFIGWADSKTATTAQYQQFETIDLTENKTVYAVWLSESAGKYPLCYSANGGDFAQSPDQVIRSSKGMVTLSSKVPTRSGYTFLGWSTYYTDQFTEYLPGSSYYVYGDPNTVDDVDTLYAVWAPTGSAVRTITYDANDGSGLVPPVRKTYGSVEMPGYRDTADPGYKLTRDGYTQMGWNTKADGSGTTYTAGASFTPSKDYTLYALWKQFTLTYDANDGVGAPGAQKGGDVTVASGRPTREGFTFLGWSTSSTATAPASAYAAGKTVTLTKDLTLYAVWQENEFDPADLNGDHEVDEGDATVLLRYLAGLEPKDSLTQEQLDAFDFNHDGETDEADVTALLKILAGLD